MHVSYLSLIEGGKRVLNDKYASSVAKFLGLSVAQVLYAIHNEKLDAARSKRQVPHRDAVAEAYLQSLRDESSWVDIRGLQVGSGKAHRFPIEELYIPLTAAPSPGESAVPLKGMLRQPRVVIVGDPGSGKTTFLRRLVFERCQARLREAPVVSSPGGTVEDKLPVFIRVSELAEHVRHCKARNDPSAPTTATAPGWLPHFLGALSAESNWGLGEDFFRQQLEGGSSIVLLDGLDETADRKEREQIATLIEKATRAYRECRFVVTTRPQVYRDKAVLTGFEECRITPLEADAIDTFLKHWSQQLFPGKPEQAERHYAELSEALRARPDIWHMARNPVVLTALAVVHWNERRLPEQRTDLYESVLVWLVRAREQKPGRLAASRALSVLQQLALAMQIHPDGRQIQAPCRWAVETLAPEFDLGNAAKAMERAERFVEEEQSDSGIVVGRGNEIRFWHLTFQEYLAARAVAGLPDADQHDLLIKNDRAYKPEWREVLLLLGGILHARQGPKKIDGLMTALLRGVEGKPSLTEEALVQGLLRIMALELKPLGYRSPVGTRHQEREPLFGFFDMNASEGDVQFQVEAAEALGQAGDPRLMKENWVTIEGGTVLMGAQSENPSAPNYDADTRTDRRESPVHEVALESFQIRRFPVTVEEYQRFVDAGGYVQSEWWAVGFGELKGPHSWEDQLLYPNRPVTNVNWYEASAYCAWAGVRLPTEAEWEWVARRPDARKYPWGDRKPIATLANYETRISNLELRLQHGTRSLLLNATTLPRKAGHDGIRRGPVACSCRPVSPSRCCSANWSHTPPTLLPQRPDFLPEREGPNHPAQVAPRSDAACRRTACGSDGLRPAAASNTARA